MLRSGGWGGEGFGEFFEVSIGPVEHGGMRNEIKKGGKSEPQCLYETIQRAEVLLRRNWSVSVASSPAVQPGLACGFV